MQDINRITLMLKVDDTARADIALTPDRTYYRFATDSSIEDGELAAVKNFDSIADEIVDAAHPRDSETGLASDVKLQLFINNRLTPGKPTEESLRRILKVVVPISPEFTFLEGFK